MAALCPTAGYPSIGIGSVLSVKSFDSFSLHALMLESTLGQKILDSLARRGIAYLYFGKEEKLELAEIVSSSELRQFYDRIGYDCVSATGDAEEVVDNLRKHGNDTANARNWSSFNKPSALAFAVYFLAYVTGSTLFDLTYHGWNETASKTSTRIGGTLLGGLMAYLGASMFRRWRQSRRRNFESQLAPERLADQPYDKPYDDESAIPQDTERGKAVM